MIKFKSQIGGVTVGNKKNWSYSNAQWHKVGRMICTACKEKITNGQYKYYETREAFFSQHRKCSEDDFRWSQMDKKDLEIKERKNRLMEACIDFQSKWSINELDDLIEELKQE